MVIITHCRRSVSEATVVVVVVASFLSAGTSEEEGRSERNAFASVTLRRHSPKPWIRLLSEVRLAMCRRTPSPQRS